MKFQFFKPNMDKLKAFMERQKEKEAKRKGGFKISVSTGIYYIGHDEQLSSAVKKIGYALTRGVNSIDISADNFNEVNLTEGQEIRYITSKQGIYLTMHGSLNVPMCVPDRIQWQEAQEHINGSIKSGVYAGAKLMNFHSCLNIWLELIQYAGRRLEVFMCDWFGRPISKICKHEKMIEWIGTMDYETSKLVGNFIWRPTNTIYSQWQEQAIKDQIKIIKANPNYRERFLNSIPGLVSSEMRDRPLEEIADAIFQINNGITLKQIFVDIIGVEEVDKNIREEVSKEWTEEIVKRLKQEDFQWEIDKSEGMIRESDFDLVVKIIAHYLWLSEDPIWKGFLEIPDSRKILERYGYDFNNPTSDIKWLDRSLRQSSENGDLEFKLFYYGVVGAKFLEGHILEAFRWMDEDLPNIIKEELKIFYRDSVNGFNEEEYKRQEKELLQNIKELAIAIENPDAREPAQAGKYMLWKPEHIYVALKTTRERLAKSKQKHFKDMVYHIFDFEQLATQGVDPLIEMKKANSTFKDLGKWTKMCHSNYPTPLHAHKSIERGDREPIYRCLWELRVTGMGKEEEAIILFERGGGQDPFKGSLAGLRAIVANLDKDVHPDKLPMTFYGIAKGTPDDFPIQKNIVWEHRFDPLKGTLKVPEETYTLLSSAAVQGGKQPKEWKAEEYQ